MGRAQVEIIGTLPLLGYALFHIIFRQNYNDHSDSFDIKRKSFKNKRLYFPSLDICLRMLDIRDRVPKIAHNLTILLILPHIFSCSNFVYFVVPIFVSICYLYWGLKSTVSCLDLQKHMRNYIKSKVWNVKVDTNILQYNYNNLIFLVSDLLNSS